MDEIKIYPEFEEFSKEVKNVWATGNILDTYKAIKELLHSKEAVENKLDYSTIIDKWKTSLELWEREFGELDAKYVGKEAKAKKKNLEEFIYDKLYLNEFSLDQIAHKRDRYLFAQWLTIPEEAKIFNNITRIINERRKLIKEGKIKKD